MNIEELEEMNVQEKEILTCIATYGFENQRNLSRQSGYSLGTVNKCMKSLMDRELIDGENKLTDKGMEMMVACRVKRAIILAAGSGMRMAPINTEVTKGLLEVKGETLIERQIKQLHEAGIFEIYVIAGFMKEQYDFLVDKYGVKMVINMEYMVKNNLYSLMKVREKLNGAYIIPCDLWFRENPFRKWETYSWYMLGRDEKKGQGVRLDRKYDVVKEDKSGKINAMVGLAYIGFEEYYMLGESMGNMSKEDTYNNSFWEDALYRDGKMIVKGRTIEDALYKEINTYEDLRELDGESSNLNSDIISLAASVFKVGTDDIRNIEVLKKGMTNRSFMFDIKGKRYLMRIPGEGADKIINRKQEYDVYQQIKKSGIGDTLHYINPDNGYKITEYIEDARMCDDTDFHDVEKCMNYLREFHKKDFKVDHVFDLYERLEYYEELWEGKKSIYRDYENTKKEIYSLKEYIEKAEKRWGLTHIDANADNFLMTKDGKICLIDWEYASMQDKDLDIVMFGIYSLYDKENMEKLFNIYYKDGISRELRLKLYAYTAVCGLMWSNWCEFKRHSGVEFGEYSLLQYRYAKDYYKMFVEELNNA